MAGKREIRLVTYTDNQLRGEKVYFLVDENGVMLTEPVKKEELGRSSNGQSWICIDNATGE